jgi:alpha-tubulin suppressor-like RCC1 family protein
MNTSIMRARTSRAFAHGGRRLVGFAGAVVLATGVLVGAVSVTPARADDCPVTYSGFYYGITGELGGNQFNSTDLMIDFDGDAVSGQWGSRSFTGTIDCDALTMEFPPTTFNPFPQTTMSGTYHEEDDPGFGVPGPWFFVAHASNFFGLQVYYGCPKPEDGHWTGDFNGDTLEADLAFEGDAVSGSMVVVGGGPAEPVSGTVHCEAPASGTSGTLSISLGSSAGQVIGEFNADATSAQGSVEGPGGGSWSLDRVFVTVTPGETLSAGGAHTCWALSAGATRCWGLDASGQIGDGGAPLNRTVPTAVSGAVFSQVSAGDSHSCGLTRNAVPMCWGENGSGQLGVNSGDTTDRAVPTAVRTSGLKTLARIEAGGAHTCALGVTGTAFCWGKNSSGQLGVGDTTDRSVPTAVHLPSGVRLVALSAGDEHTCGLSTNGFVYCWGENGKGQLGLNDTTDRTVPERAFGDVADEEAFLTTIAAGGAHTCAGADDGRTYCWGEGGNGQLGLEDMTAHHEPVRVPNLVTSAISAAGNHTCAIDSASSLGLCWGANNRFQNGVPDPIDNWVAKEVQGGLAFDEISAGYEHSCGLSGGSAYCWGANTLGQLGTGDLSDRDAPTPAGSDSTPPVVVGSVSPAPDLGFWHRGTPVVSWSVTDPESTITTPSCPSMLISVDSPPSGTIVPCTATSAGGTTVQQVTVHRDATAPVVTVIGPTNGGSYTPATLPPSDCSTLDPSSNVATPASRSVVYVSSSGSNQTYSVRCSGAVDNAGNVAPMVWVTYTLASSTAPSELSSGSVNVNGSVTTDPEADGVNSTDTVETTVTSPVAGQVSITEQPTTLSTAGYSFAGTQVQISAPTASAAAPLTLRFDIDSSALPVGVDKDNIDIFRTVGGQTARVNNCVPLGVTQVPQTPVPQVACVTGRDFVPLAAPDIRITVITSQASLWNLGTVAPRPAQLAVGDVSIVEGDSGTRTAYFPVTLSAGAANAVTVQYATHKVVPGASAEDFTAVGPKTLTFNPGQVSKTVAMILKPDTNPEPDETFALTLSSPTNAGLGRDTGTATIVDDDTNDVGVSVGSASVVEGDAGTRAVTVPVTLDAPATGTVSVSYQLVGSATGVAKTNIAGDYVTKSGTLTFSPGQFKKTIPLTVLADYNAEPDETIDVVAVATAGPQTITAQGTVTILNDDFRLAAPARVAVGDVTIVEGDSGARTAYFPVTLSAGSAVPVSVGYGTAKVTADAGDFTALTNKTLTFSPGQVTRTVAVALKPDTNVEPDETFQLQLVNPVNAVLSDDKGTATIRDDDTNDPGISLGDVSIAEGDSGTRVVTIPVTLASPATGNIAVSYSVSPGSASGVANAKIVGDYINKSGTLTFAAGQWKKTITLTILADGDAETDETFSILAIAADASGTTTATNTITITNDD